VDEGQPLLELKNADLQLRLVEAEARLTEQVNNLNARRLQVEQANLQFQERLLGIAEQITTTQQDLARNERLQATGAVPAKLVEDMRNSLDTLRGVQATVQEAQRVNRSMQTSQTAQLQSSVDSMSASLDVARENLSNLLVRAPISGRLVDFRAAIGESKAQGQRIGQVDDIGVFKVAVMMDEFYLGRVAIGQLATARIDATDYELIVSKIYPNVQERLFQMDLAFSKGQPSSLRRGQTLQLKLQTGALEESLVVANGPWVDDSGGAWAYVVSADSREAVRRTISIGRRNPEAVEISDGIEEGDRIVVSSYAPFAMANRIDVTDSEGR
jgi:HlyD family secretion protein